MDVPSFLRMYPPFDDPGDERMAEVVLHTHIEFFPAGTDPAGDRGALELPVHRSTRSGRAPRGRRSGRLLGEREVFGFVSLLSGVGPSLSVKAHEMRSAT
ncbi:MAG: hypothetical protein L0206_09950 [Actinobacteria bacterium]|nr:hypothetical protein [Actinomycetota bacterium]